MSEHGPAAPAPSPESSDEIGGAARAMAGEFSEVPAESADTESESGAAARDLMDGLNAAIGDERATTTTAPEPRKDRTLERPKDILELSPEEEVTKARLEKITEKRIEIRDRVTPRINRLSERTDKARDFRDKATKKATLLEYREGAQQRKSTRLEARLEKAREGSGKYRRIQKKYGKTNRKLGEVQTRIGILDRAPETRERQRTREEELRRKEIQLRRDMLQIEKKVALEKKNRRKISKEMNKAKNGQQREWLKQELTSLPKIGAFREDLLKEATSRYKSRAKATTRPGMTEAPRGDNSGDSDDGDDD